MSNVLNRTTCEYLKSVNTPDYPTKDWIINPDLKNVQDLEVPCCYWKTDGDTVIEMSTLEKTSMDTAIAAKHEINTVKKLYSKTEGLCKCSNTAN